MVMGGRGLVGGPEDGCGWQGSGLRPEKMVVGGRGLAKGL